MTTKKKTTLILGAGASCGYGFPVGSQLRGQILALRDNDEASEVMMQSKSSIRYFVDAFLASQAYSIDLFLGRRQEFSDIGKAAIAYVLLNSENKAKLNSDDNADHWYQYLLHQLAPDAWSEFDPGWLSIVTFNYDRSLEEYLTRSLMHSYKKTEEEVLEKLKALQMVHVYGKLGHHVKGQGDPHIRFGGLSIDEKSYYVGAAAKELVIIPEGRDESESITAARAVIDAAEQICLLGFGFDATNIRRLGAPMTFSRTLGGAASQQINPKKTVATCLGLTRAEIGLAITNMFGPNVDKDAVKKGFLHYDCVSTLRESLILN